MTELILIREHQLGLNLFYTWLQESLALKLVLISKLTEATRPSFIPKKVIESFNS